MQAPWTHWLVTCFIASHLHFCFLCSFWQKFPLDFILFLIICLTLLSVLFSFATSHCQKKGAVGMLSSTGRWHSESLTQTFGWCPSMVFPFNFVHFLFLVQQPKEAFQGHCGLFPEHLLLLSLNWKVKCRTRKHHAVLYRTLILLAPNFSSLE